MRIASLLSLVGVLAAGSAAAAVNTDAFVQSAGSDANAHIGVNANASVEHAVQIQSDSLTDTQVMFQVREAGFVTLDTANDVLVVVAIALNSGWELVDTRTDGATRVEVVLALGDDLLGFEAELIGGLVVTEIDDTPDGAGGNTDGTTGSGTSSESQADGNGTDDTAGSDAANDGTDDNANDGSANCNPSGFITICADADADADADVDLNDD